MYRAFFIVGLILAASAAGARGSTPPEAVSPADFQLSLQSPAYADASTPGQTEQRPLMNLLDVVGVGQALDRARINIYGWVEGSYTYNFDRPRQKLNLGRVFDVQDDHGLVNQVDLTLERTVDLTSHQFDVGGRVDLLYGGDSRFIHSSGFLDGQDFFHGPEYQFDIPQLYVDLAIPVGTGLRLRLGKFLFFKQIDPNASVFYSHSFTFGAALPFTLTGISALYNINDQLSVEGGISRGWGQTFRDNNGAIDGFGRVRYSPSDRTTLTLAVITGPEDTHDNGHYRTAVDGTISQALSDNATFLLDAVYGNDAAGSANGTNASWYGVAGYGVLRLDSHVSAALRLEWYRDEEGFTTAVAQNLYEATLGLTITPFPDDPVGSYFKLRPEVRYDYSTHRFFSGLTRHDQTTVAIDAIFNF